MGRASYDVGRDFDARIATAFTVAQQQHIVAWHAHQQPAFTISRRPIARSGTDFVSVLKGGLMLCVEVKSVKGERLEFDAFRPEQVAHLYATAQAGGVALVAIEFRSEAELRAFLIPWSELGALWTLRKTRRSVDMGQIPETWRMPHENVIASRLQKCDGCGAYRGLTGPRTTCCWGAGPPF